MAKNGRPTAYTPELGEKICELISEDLTLEEIAKKPGFPSERTILRWAISDKLPEFCHLYDRAREIQGHAWQERLRSVHKKVSFYYDEEGNMRTDTGSVNLLKLESENLKWLMSKRLPKQFGDKPDPAKDQPKQRRYVIEPIKTPKTDRGLGE